MKKYAIITFLLCLLLSAAQFIYANGPIDDPSFENFASSLWSVYSTDDPAVSPVPIEAGGIGIGSTFSLLYPPYVPDGSCICGLQSSGEKKNAGIYQSFMWSGAPATISLTARAYSVQLPENGGQPYDNGCRVRMGLVSAETTNPADVTNWVVFPWSNEWQTLKMTISETGEYTIFIEGVQPTDGMITTTDWDNIVFTECQFVKITDTPNAVINTDADHPDTSMIIEWTTDVPSTSQLDYGTDSSYGQTLYDYSLKTDHKVVINNLTPSTTYHYKITCGAPDHMNITSSDLTFKTPIQFSNIATSYSVNSNDVVVTWNTDVPTTSQIAYGLTSCDTYTTEDTTLVTSHSITLTGLDENKDYNFKVIGRNQPKYTDATSAMQSFHTLPYVSSSLKNGSFEDINDGSHSIFPWVQYDTVISGCGTSPIDGLVSSPFPVKYSEICPINIAPYDGSYFVGAASYFGYENGGVFQRVKYPAGQTCILSARYLTYTMGGSQTDTQLRLGIDPNGGTDPLSSDVKWKTAISSTNDSQWHLASLTAQAGDNGQITVFLDIVQDWTIPWHIVAVDDVVLGAPNTFSIGELKSSSNPCGTIEDKIVTCVEDTAIPYLNSQYTKAYVEDDNRTSGVCVLFDPQNGDIPAVGSRVTVTGYLEKFNKEASLIANDWKMDIMPYQLPAPLAMPQKFVGGKSINQDALYGSTGLCNVGLRVRLFGRVSSYDLPDAGIAAGNDATVYFDDGSKLLDHTPTDGTDPVYGIRAHLKANQSYGIKAGDYLIVTGVLSIEKVDPDSTANSGDEYYAYTIVTNSGDDWSIASAK